MSRPPADPQVIRAQQDEDWEKCPAVTRLGAEGAIRRDRLSTRLRPTATGLPGTAGRSAGAMANLRAKLNSLRAGEGRSGGAKTTSFTSVVESARTTQEPFVPKSTINVAVTPTNKGTFEAKCIPLANKCDFDWVAKRGYRGGKTVKACLQITAPVKDDANPEDVAALEATLDKLKPMRDMLNKEADEMSVYWGVEDAPHNASGRAKKQLVVRVFGRDEEADVARNIIADMGEDIWGDVNPLVNHMDVLLKGASVKLEFGEDLTETMVSRDAAMKPLGNVRMTTKADVTSELASKLYPACLKTIMELSARGYQSRRAREGVQASLATTLPLFAARKVATHVTMESPEFLAFNIIRQLTFLNRAQGDMLPGTTFNEESVATKVSKVTPVGATGLNLWNFMHFQWLNMVIEGEDELMLTPIVLAASKVCGPIESVEMDGSVLSARITAEGIDPAKHEIGSLEGMFTYLKAMNDATKKADRRSNAFNPDYSGDDGSDDGGSEGSGSEDDERSDDGEGSGNESGSDDGEEAKLEKLGRGYQKEVMGAFKKSGLKKNAMEERSYGFLGYQQKMNRTNREFHNLGTYNQRVNRRNAALVIGVLSKNPTAAVRAWSTENRIDGDVFDEENRESMIGRYTAPDGRSVLFISGEGLYETAETMKGVFGRLCDAFVVVEGEGEPDSEMEQFMGMAFGLDGKDADPSKFQFDFLHGSNSEIFHVKEGAEPLDKGALYTRTFAVANMKEGGSDLSAIRDEIVASARSKHPSATASNGWDYPYTHMLTMGKAITKGKKARKEAEAKAQEQVEAMMAGMAGCSSGSSDYSDEE